MRKHITLTLFMLVSIFAPVMAWSQEAEKQFSDPKDPRSKPWREQAAAMKLSAGELRLLEQNKFVIGQRRYAQVFTPYLGGSVPVFITCDSLINAYHVLFEESMKRIERAQAAKLPKVLREMWKNLDGIDKDAAGDSEVVKSARRRARIVLGTAIKLLGDAPLEPAADPQIDAQINKEMKKVVDATAVDKSAWLGEPDADFRALNYSRFKPRGFYAGDARLERFFRAVAWLETIPFRVDDTEELVSALILAHALPGGPHGDLHTFLETYEKMIGVADDPGLDCMYENLITPEGGLNVALPRGLLEFREGLHREHSAPGARINDQVRAARGGGDGPAGLSIRIIPARRLLDAVMFQETTDRKHFPRAYPNGLEVAAMLGSPFAAATLDKDAGHRDELLAAIGDHRLDPEKARYGSLYVLYLHSLSALFESPEKDVPELFSSQAWQIKSCQTALAGWAQMRHAWILHAKENQVIFGAMRQPAGFVEPVPEFFSRFSHLVEQSQSLLKKSGAFEPDIWSQAAKLRKLAQAIENAKADAHGIVPDQELNRADQSLEYSLDSIVQLMRDHREGVFAGDLLRSDVPKLRALANQLDRGELPANLELRAALGASSETYFEPLWQSLSILSRRLEALAHKQLRGVPFNEEEDALIKNYGEKLAAYMFYFGHSYDFPRDDAPRVADVFSNPNEGKVLEVGIDRAQVIYVLYPWHGREILCRGAVMPYCEFKSAQRLTDDQWKTLLDSPQRPERPDWVTPIYSRIEPVKPVSK